ncbi:D-alanyl-D-alanine carboxypeptidase [Aetokthonos hydrillicola Thurmond2011]|jgi:D-alanyl-D-alanine carboxypeptidase/D-alanyl-D-alanine-endopeptidase (penicillin-binding protein 4)|uniref:D-alanyl-D-alanine carboxypeptidase n=1 Tax=Aetokthonos hydrillicola Thurmond2011 TaxID=2712845 RepID=A0AAP5M8Y2_9CYAN|nr:D-alanyl-D-alanine carboxypeptidase [Aetokthonos hydrillicola]MBO3458075.1 D-alanyl-D-alanine carboxypeptidase [Aetokthonos hydrillicola CCALA 1050]MBW4587089.1 D-alanyl-D-alanine carboxypeptidase [Aetokthonos hydrillicola CCALA 1050]MDR9899661.1 D-alanyl-D-alanine carboxypeptidase [Aetokthonos hydrillicola Thurmond2011]
MLELFGSGLISLWLKMAGVQVKPLDALDILSWQISPGLVLASDPNPAGSATVQEYLKELQTLKLVNLNEIESQGVWMQSGPMLMANHQGTTPLPAASLTKIATTLVALKNLGPDHQFQTLVSATGPLQNGVLQGDLVITAEGDPLFVWEEAIAIGNALNKMGITQVKGKLLISGNFALNFQRNPILAGQLLKQALNHTTWPRAAAFQYSRMRKGTPKPKVVITGPVQLASQENPGQTLLLRHYSLPLKQLIKEMNVFSNNDMAEMLAQAVGGATVVQSTAAQLAQVPESEIQLINGSGLGAENRISPRAVCAMLMAVQREAFAHQLDLADLFLISGLDHRGTLYGRHLPLATVIKTGTLKDVSALAGVMPTRDRGLVWFAIVNRGTNVSAFRTGQDKLLQRLAQQLQAVTSIPNVLIPHGAINVWPEYGAVNRNEIVFKG